MNNRAVDRETYWAPYACIDARVRRNVRLVVQSGVFSEITCDAERMPSDMTLTGMVIPGMADCHSHAFHRALRGLGKEGRTFWSWRETMYRIAANLTPELYYRYARAVYTEMLLAGYTTVAEFHYVHHQPDGSPYEDPNIMGKALIRAAREAGIRLTLLDACYLHADVKGSPLSERQRRFCDGDADRWRARVERLERDLTEDERRTTLIGAAVHSVRACSPQEASVVSQWASSHGEPRPLHIHLSEQPAENQTCVDRYGMSPTELMDTVDFWSGNTVAVHATHLTAKDIEILSSHGSSVAFCPTTEADLADGIGPAGTLFSYGVPLCIGSDENVSIDPFEEIRQLDAHERLATGRRDTFEPADLLEMMTSNGQKACGWSSSGRLEVGCNADFVVLGLDFPRLAGVNPDSAVLVAASDDVSDVFVSGQRVVENGRHRNGAPSAVIADLTARLRA